MSEASIPDRVAALQAVLQPPTGPSVARKASLPELEELKRWLDNSRLEVWGKLRAAQEPTVPDFEHKFRIRRAVELCDGLSADIRAHRLASQQGELAVLERAAQELGQAIRAARG